MIISQTGTVDYYILMRNVEKMRPRMSAMSPKASVIDADKDGQLRSAETISQGLFPHLRCG